MQIACDSERLLVDDNAVTSSFLFLDIIACSVFLYFSQILHLIFEFSVKYWQWTLLIVGCACGDVSLIRRAEDLPILVYLTLTVHFFMHNLLFIVTCFAQ